MLESSAIPSSSFDQLFSFDEEFFNSMDNEQCYTVLEYCLENISHEHMFDENKQESITQFFNYLAKKNYFAFHYQKHVEERGGLGRVIHCEQEEKFYKLLYKFYTFATMNIPFLCKWLNLLHQADGFSRETFWYCQIIDCCRDESRQNCPEFLMLLKEKYYATYETFLLYLFPSFTAPGCWRFHKAWPIEFLIENCSEHLINGLDIFQNNQEQNENLQNFLGALPDVEDDKFYAFFNFLSDHDKDKYVFFYSRCCEHFMRYGRIRAIGTLSNYKAPNPIFMYYFTLTDYGNDKLKEQILSYITLSKNYRGKLSIPDELVLDAQIGEITQEQFLINFFTIASDEQLDSFCIDNSLQKEILLSPRLSKMSNKLSKKYGKKFSISADVVNNIFYALKKWSDQEKLLANFFPIASDKELDSLFSSRYIPNEKYTFGQIYELLCKKNPDQFKALNLLLDQRKPVPYIRIDTENQVAILKKLDVSDDNSATEGYIRPENGMVEYTIQQKLVSQIGYVKLTLLSVILLLIASHKKEICNYFKLFFNTST